MKEEALRRWLGEQVSRMDELKESLDQKRRDLTMQALVREKKGSAEEGRRYGAQEEWERGSRRKGTKISELTSKAEERAGTGSPAHREAHHEQVPPPPLNPVIVSHRPGQFGELGEKSSLS